MSKNGKRAISVEIVLDTINDESVDLEHNKSIRQHVALNPVYEN